MKDYNSLNPVSIIVKICSIVAVCIAGGIGIAYFKADIRILLAFIAFLLLYVLLPGSLVVKNIRLKSEHISTDLIRSFFMGFALNVLLYFLTILIDTNIILYVTGPILSFFWLIRMFRSGLGQCVEKTARVIKRVPTSFFAFAALVFIYSILTTQYTYISPDNSAYSFIKIDFAYHAGIVNALAAGYPPLDPWVSGLTIQYHFFAEMLLSIPVRLFGLPSESLIMSGTPILITPVLSVSLYAFFREFSDIKERSGLYCLAFQLSNMFILKRFAYSWFLYHIYSNINNAGLGIACMLTALPLLKEWDACSGRKTQRFNTKEMLFLALLVMLMTGIKGPMALVFVGGVFGTMLLGLILRKVDLILLGPVALSMISFIIIYIYVLGAQHSNTTGGSVFNIGEVTDIFYIKKDLMGLLHNMGFNSIVTWLLLFAVFSLFYMTAFLLPFLIGYLRELVLVISGRKEFLFSKVTVYACCLVGFIAMMLLDFNGHSQVYFGFVTCMLVPAVAFWFFEDVRFSKNIGIVMIRVIFVLALCATTYTSLLFIYSSANDAQAYYLSHNEDNQRYRNVSAEEYKGLIWLRDNTENNALVASDRYYSVDPSEYVGERRNNNTHFAYAVYSRRRQYIEGSGFSMDSSHVEKRMEMIRTNKRLYDPHNDERGDLARSLGVDYVVVSKRFNDTGNLENSDYELCYSNEEMDIYRIKETS